MALVLADRVQETSTSTGTGAFTLDGAVTGYQTFAVIGNGNTTYYTIADQGGANWEVGIGTYTSSGTSLSRDTVLSSSNGGSLVPFTSGTKTVFVTYPSSKSVNLSAAGNVSALGTVTSGTWQGSTVGVAYGGTGVTASSGANSVVLRDANQNIAVNRVNQSNANTTAAGGTTALTTASSYIQTLVGTGGQIYTLPDATTLATGVAFLFNNLATGTLTVEDYATAVIATIPSGGAGAVFLTNNATVGGTWDLHAYLPEGVTFGTNAFNLGTAIVSGGTWQGGTIQPAYGGTGLTTFTGANNALFSTGATTLTAGTLPVAAGGTGVTSSTGTGSVVLSNSPTLVTPALGTPSSVNLTNATNVPVNQATGTLAIANGGTGQTTAGAAFNALSPITTTGDLIVGNGSNSATRLGIGSTGQVLTVSGGTATWVTPTTGGGTITRTDFTATGGQTVFTVSYTVGLIDVYRNGVKLATTDFTATNGTSFTLAVAANAGDIVQAVVFSSLNLYSTITYQVFNGDGTTTVFTMNSVPANTASLLVAISGVVQDPGTYTVSSTTLTFFTAPPSGTGNISVRYLGIASVGTVGSFSAGTTGLTPSSATTGAVVLAGTLNVANGGTGATSLAGANIAVTNATNTFTVDQSISGLTVGKGANAVLGNTVVGNNALASGSQSGTYGVAIGTNALTANTSGGNNVGVGTNALTSNTTGANSIAIGRDAAQSNTTGSSNVAIGGSALQSNTTASNNTAVGYQAGYSNTTGGITAVGRLAAYSNTTALEITAIGNSALYSNTGARNTGVGETALYANTTGVDNVGMGVAAFRFNTTGGSNVGIGNYALYSNTTASNNTAVGYQALYSQTTPSAANSGLGYQAGYSITTGIQNTCMGTESGRGVTTGAGNTFLGHGSGYYMTTGSKNTIVGKYDGNQGGLDIRTASNYIVLSDGDGNPELIMGGGYNALTNQQIITSNTKGGTVNILSRAQVFPTDNTITSAILLITAVASEGTSGGYTRSDVVFVSKRFGNQVAQTNIGVSDGISASNWTYGFDGSNFRVTQNWGAGGSTLGTRWSILVVSGANVG